MPDKENEYQGESLANRFLVSMPQMEDPNFTRTVILVCKHDQEGAVGIVVNRLTEHRIGDIFEQLGIELDARKVVNSQIVHTDAVSDANDSHQLA